MIVISKVVKKMEKKLVAITLLLFCLKCVSGGFIHAMKEEEYNIISRLVKDGKCLIPVQERTKAEKSAYMKFWRIREKLSLDKNGKLLYEGKRVLKKTEVKNCVSKTFNKSKCVDYKKLRTRALDGYAGISRGNILKVTTNDAEFKKFNVKFTNKAIPKPVTAKGVRLLALFCC